MRRHCGTCDGPSRGLSLAGVWGREGWDVSHGACVPPFDHASSRRGHGRHVEDANYVGGTWAVGTMLAHSPKSPTVVTRLHPAQAVHLCPRFPPTTTTTIHPPLNHHAQSQQENSSQDSHHNRSGGGVVVVGICVRVCVDRSRRVDARGARTVSSETSTGAARGRYCRPCCAVSVTPCCGMDMRLFWRRAQVLLLLASRTQLPVHLRPALPLWQ